MTTFKFNGFRRQQTEEMNGSGVTRTRITRANDTTAQVVKVLREAWTASTVGFKVASTRLHPQQEKW